MIFRKVVEKLDMIPGVQISVLPRRVAGVGLLVEAVDHVGVARPGVADVVQGEGQPQPTA